MKQTQTPQPEQRHRGGAPALALAMLLGALGTSIANIALPALAEAFSAPFDAVQAVVVAYLAALTASVLVAGRLGDRYGLKPALLAGLGLFALASLLCGLAPTLPQLVVLRALQGIAAGFLMTLSMALMRETVGETRLGRAMGLLGTASALGTALGPSLGGVLIAIAGWRWVFLAQAPLAMLAMLLAWLTLPNAAFAPKPPASLLAALSHGLLPNLAVNGIVSAVMMATLLVGPFYLGVALGLDSLQVGLAMSVGPVISILAGFPAGRLVDARGDRPVLLFGLTLLTAGALLLVLLPLSAGLVGYVAAIAVLTPGYQLFQAANNTAALAGMAKENRGTASGLLNLARNLGLILGASGLGAVFALGTGSGEFSRAGPEAIAAGMRLVFLAAAVMTGLAAMTIGLIGGGLRRPTTKS